MFIDTTEPVTTQAPTPSTPSTPSTSSIPSTTTTSTTSSLPLNYLNNGYYATSDKGASYLRPEFVGAYAEQIAANLSIMRPSDFNGLLREMKRSKKKTLPFEARQTAAAEMLPKALALVHRKKAPVLLVEFIKANLDAIHTDEDWTAYLRHLEAINGYLSMNTIIS